MDNIKDARNGFIVSSNYPNFVSDIREVDCMIQMTPRDGYGVNVYLIDLAMVDPEEDGRYVKEL